MKLTNHTRLYWWCCFARPVGLPPQDCVLASDLVRDCGVRRGALGVTAPEQDRRGGNRHAAPRPEEGGWPWSSRVAEPCEPVTSGSRMRATPERTRADR